MKLSLIYIGVILAIFYKIAQDFDVFKDVSPINKYGDCKYFKEDIQGPEDMAYYNKTTIIVGSGNLRKVFALGKPELEQQNIYAILNANKPDFKVLKLKINNFPQKIAFYPQGINIRKQVDGTYLYAVNHAYQNGGERVEIFKFDQDLNLTYVQSIIMDDKYRGILNDLIVIENDRFLITKELPYPDPIEGRQHVPAFELIQTLFFWMTSQKKSYVIDCKIENYNTDCKELLTVNGIMLNGITWNQKDIIWIADTYAKGIHEYQITKQGFKLNRFININNAIDNIEYIEESNTILIGLIPKLHNFFALDTFVKQNELDRQTNLEYWGSVGQYNLNSNQFDILVQNRYLSKGLSGALISGQNLFIASWCDISVMVCRKI